MAGADARPLAVRGERRALLLGKGLWQRLGARPQQRTHIFVAGMQRSGTNMVMEVLERSPRTDVYHESDARAFDRFEMRDEGVIRQLAARSRAPFFVIKALCELDRIRHLMDAFGPARTLWILRDMEDVVNSAVHSFRNFPAQLERIVANRNAAQWRGRGMSDETHAHLRALYHSGMDEASAAALTWYFRNVLYFDQGLDRDPRVMLVTYESLVAEPHAVFPRIFAFLGLEYSRWVARIVHARSVGRRPPPQLEPGVKALCEGLEARFRAVTGEVAINA